MRRAVTITCLLAALTATMAAAQPPSRSPRTNYMVNCQGCHLPGGEGVYGKVPPMRGHLANFLMVPGGREFLIRVPGVANSTLNDDDLTALMNWLVPAMGPDVPDGFAPYTTDEIRRLRHMRLQDVGTLRAALIDQMPPDRRAAMLGTAMNR